MTGACVLGSTLRVGGITGLPNVAFQWFRIAPSGVEELIGGATRQQYAPEPRDVGLTLRCAVTASPGEAPQMISSPQAVTDMEGLSSTVAGAANLESVEFNCVVVQRNGEMQDTMCELAKLCAQTLREESAPRLLAEMPDLAGHFEVLPD